ncbi:SipW-dependent-type signal peptide-containing protein [Corynebacterium halotolerans]|uniref:SipW-dependent-type signal peptide-containing protein n=1 Tax=Corynebacterium halotolerans TaxID=225326 RepID=UPI003CF29D4C
MQAVPRTSRRVRAVIAAAAVLGFGSVATLAFWSDSEFLSATFWSPGFQVEGATSASGPFESHDSADDAAALQFVLPAGELAEGEPVSTGYWLRMASESTGTVSVLAPTVENEELNGLIDVAVAKGSCDSPGEVLQEGLLEELADAPDAFNLPAGVDGEPGSAQAVCITATLNDISELPAGEHSTGRVGWQFRVTEEAV